MRDFLDAVMMVQVAKGEAAYHLFKWLFILAIIFFCIVGIYVVFTGSIPTFDFRNWYCG